MKTLRDCQSCLADDDIANRLEKSSSRLLCFLALLALIGGGGCSASGPEPSFETAYSLLQQAVALCRSDPSLEGGLVNTLRSWGRVNRFCLKARKGQCWISIMGRIRL